MLLFLWRATRGYRLTPWKSPYLLWRIETFTGRKSSEIGFAEFAGFAWTYRDDLIRYLRWASRMQQ